MPHWDSYYHAANIVKRLFNGFYTSCPGCAAAKCLFSASYCKCDSCSLLANWHTGYSVCREINIPLPSLTWFIIAEQTSQRGYRNWTIATLCQWSKATSTSFPTPHPDHNPREEKREEGVGVGVSSQTIFHLPAGATCFTYETHLSPFNSHEIAKETVRASRGQGGSDVERLEGPLHRILHYSLVTASEYYPCENTLSPLGG